MWRIKMTDEIDMIIEDDSDSWQAQLEEQQRSEEERPSLRKLTERLGQAIAILNVLDPEIQLLRDRMLTLKADIEKESEKLSAGVVEAARRAGL
jgi:hypothetical protein